MSDQNKSTSVFSIGFYPFALTIIVSVAVSMIGAKMLFDSQGGQQQQFDIRILDPYEINLTKHGIEDHVQLQETLDRMGSSYAVEGKLLIKATDIVGAPSYMYVSNREFGEYVRNSGAKNGKE